MKLQLQTPKETGNFKWLIQPVHAVFKKVVMLILPYLHKYGYERTVDRVEGNATVMAAPRSDLHAPDLYIPMMAMFTYVVLAAGNKFANGLFTPDVVHSMVSTRRMHSTLMFDLSASFKTESDRKCGPE